MSVELAYRYVVVKATKGEPLQYYNLSSDMCVSNMRDCSFMFCVDSALCSAERLNHQAKRGTRYSALAIRADAMPYKKWMDGIR